MLFVSGPTRLLKHPCYFSHRREEVPWVLSNGDRWVFGISHANNDDWGCVYFEPRLLFGEILRRSEPQQSKEAPSSARSCRSANGKRRKIKSGELDAIMGRPKAVVRILTVWVSKRPRCCTLLARYSLAHPSQSIT